MSLNKASFLKTVRDRLPAGHSIAFQGRDRLDIRRPDKSCAVFTGINWRTNESLNRVLADPIFSKEN